MKAVTEAARLNASGASYAPLTVFYRDAVGNIIRTIQYANGTPQASEAGYTETSSGDNRYTFAAYDSRGNKIQTIDANGARTTIPTTPPASWPSNGAASRATTAASRPGSRPSSTTSWGIRRG